MATNSRSSAYLAPWHFDCRLSKELPDDKAVRGRFLINLTATAILLSALMGTTYVVYGHFLLRHEITSWQHRLDANQAEAKSVTAVVNAINAGAKRLDVAYSLVNSPLVASDFIQAIGQSRPAAVRLDMIESSSSGVILRGGLRESSQRASVLLSRYVADLRGDAQLASLFTSISLTSWERNPQGDTINFEITFKVKSDTP